MKSYYRVMLGQKSVYANECFKSNFIGADFGINQDLSNQLPENWRDFNLKFIPIYLSTHPNKNKIAAGLACGFLWTVSKGIVIGDLVLCPNGSGSYLIGEVVENYSYHPNEILPHRRTVKWYDKLIERTQMSEALQRSTGSIGTLSDISKYADEIENLMKGAEIPKIISTDESIEEPSAFVFEKHLEDFLIQNWNQAEFGKDYDVFSEDGELVGRQYQTDTGPIDILAISKDKKVILVIELKKGRASDNVVGQVQRYMGYVKEELAEEGQIVKGVIIALEEDLKIKRALSVASNIDFYRYQINFKLFKS